MAGGRVDRGSKGKSDNLENVRMFVFLLQHYMLPLLGMKNNKIRGTFLFCFSILRKGLRIIGPSGKKTCKHLWLELMFISFHSYNMHATFL